MKAAYQYKLQWLFEVKESFFDTQLALRRRLYSFIRIIKGENITALYFRDCEGKIINKHTLKNPGTFWGEFATKKVISYIKSTLEKDSRVYSVELIRK